MRLALTKKAPKDLPANIITFAPGIVSCIDSGDFAWVDKREIQAQRQELAQAVEQLVIETPSITKPELAEKTGASEWEVRNILKRLGYQRTPGGKKGATQWSKPPGKNVDSAA